MILQCLQTITHQIVIQPILIQKIENHDDTRNQNESILILIHILIYLMNLILNHHDLDHIQDQGNLNEKRRDPNIANDHDQHRIPQPILEPNIHVKSHDVIEETGDQKEVDQDHIHQDREVEEDHIHDPHHQEIVNKEGMVMIIIIHQDMVIIMVTMDIMIMVIMEHQEVVDTVIHHMVEEEEVVDIQEVEDIEEVEVDMVVEADLVAHHMADVEADQEDGAAKNVKTHHHREYWVVLVYHKERERKIY
mmetsp:Transcript_4003/g.3472  ORF Transcript_4003/g.3472 Transcript_4003/m.3472 type:complete len:249 (-) Transcript_4003:282-1028(-)